MTKTVHLFKIRNYILDEAVNASKIVESCNFNHIYIEQIGKLL